ncbi:MAG: glycosyl hydrolase family 28-related protein [Eubacteriales bacterium]
MQKTNGSTESIIEIYPVPSCYNEVENIVISVNGRHLPLIAYNEQYDYCHFSFSGCADIKICNHEAIVFSQISPLIKNIPSRVSANTLEFSLESSQYLIVKINKNKEIIVAADSIEENAPMPCGDGIFNITDKPYCADPHGKSDSSAAINSAIADASESGGGIVYVPAGVFSVANIILKSNVSLYLCGGAVLREKDSPDGMSLDFTKHGISGKVCDYPGTWMIRTEAYSENIRIYGRGTIDANGTHLRTEYKFLTTVVACHQCRNFSAEGVIIRDGGLWSFLLIRSRDINIFGTKHLNEVDLLYENDAIDVLESQNVNICHTIAIAEDDAYSLKAYGKGNGDIKSSWVGDPQQNINVTFDDCFAWTRCGAFKIGWGVFSDMNNIVFRNSYVYSCMTGVNMTHYSGKGTAENIIYENIDIESFRSKSDRDRTCMWLIADITDRGGGAGSIRNVTVKDINVRRPDSAPCVIRGYDEEAAIDGMLFENIILGNEKVQSAKDMGISETDEFVRNIIVTP